MAVKKRHLHSSDSSEPKAKRTRVQDAATEIPLVNSKAGAVYVMGEGEMGALGLGSADGLKEGPRTRTTPTAINTKLATRLSEAVVKVVAGGLHSMALTASGKVFSWGCADDGTLGRQGPEFFPVQVKGALESAKVSDICGGLCHSAALTSAGQVYIWGTFKDSGGRFGLLHGIEYANEPVLVENLPTVKKIVSGENHILALTVRGEVFSWGSGENGQLGRVGARFADRSCLRKACQREALLTPKSLKLVTKLAKATNIFTGMNHSFALTDKHGLVGWGLNNCGQLGTRHVHSKGVLCCFSPVVIDYFHGHDIIEVAGGDHHTLVLVHPTTVYSCGDGQYGRLGIGRDFHQANDMIVKTPVQIPNLFAKAIACGDCVSFAISVDNTCYGWGSQTSNQLGDLEDDAWTPTKITEQKLVQIDGGGQHTIMLAES